jgi:alkylated DNA repair dioxygenase AlkB
MKDLTSDKKGLHKLDLPDADITYDSNFFSAEEASKYFMWIQKGTDWKLEPIKIFGRVYQQPRLTALYGIEVKTYSYSGITMNPKPFNTILEEIRIKVEKVSKTSFNTVLLNLYRDGNDSNGWHSDDEEELGQNPSIASVSLGAERYFQLKHKKDVSKRFKICLESGSLLVMKGPTQHYWKHQIPKTKKVTSPRINLTFRNIK